MRIGIVCVIKESWGGSEELWAAMANEAISQGHEILVCAYDCGEVHPKMKKLLNKGVKIVYRRGYIEPGIPTWKRIWKKAKNIALNKITNQFSAFIKYNADCIIYNGTSYTCLEDIQLFDWLIISKKKYYYLSHIASDYYRPMGLRDIPLIAKSFNYSTGNLFVAKRTYKITERHIASIIPNKKIVRNPVNLAHLQPVQYPQINNIINFATVGLLVAAHKGQDMLFEVLSSETWRNRNWHLNIYGSGVDENYLKQLTKMYGITNHVTFHGKVSDVKKIWEYNHILLMPSLMEGMPLAVVEAMICSRPCVVTDVGDQAEWIEENKEGFIAEAPSPYSISGALERAWSQKNNWEEMGSNAHQKAMKMYDTQAGKSLLNLLTNNSN